MQAIFCSIMAEGFMVNKNKRNRNPIHKTDAKCQEQQNNQHGKNIKQENISRSVANLGTKDQKADARDCPAEQ